jgi:hypothetical protein
MKRKPGVTKIAALAAVVMGASFTVVGTSNAGTGTVTKADLSGPWQMTLSGITGCGLVSMQANFTLDTSGVATNAVLKTHGQCGDATVSGLNFTVFTLNANGSGTANLTCGVGCGWNLNIQVSSDRATFNAIDVDPVNPNNFIAGVAIHQ